MLLASETWISSFLFYLDIDLNLLCKLLQENYKEMSRWDVYTAEVESGHLDWGIVHSEMFFKEHAKRFEGKNGDFELLRVRIASMMCGSMMPFHI